VSGYYFRALPYLDRKWLKADITAALENAEEQANLWNHLVQDSEITTTKFQVVVNGAGNKAYNKEDGKYFCGAELLACNCCKGKYCGLTTACSCTTCQQIEGENLEPSKKSQVPSSDNLQFSSSMLDKWSV
jgi:E3 ubiquitin-protein ligase HERC2